MKSVRCRLRQRPAKVTQGTIPLLLCLDLDHREWLERHAGAHLHPLACPEQALKCLEGDPTRVVLVDSCRTHLPCCRQLLRELQARLLALRSLQACPEVRARSSRPMSRARRRLSSEERLRATSRHVGVASKHRFDLAQLARLHGVGGRQLTRLYRQAGRTSPIRQVLRQRLLLAREMVRTSRESIETIAHELGFSDGATLRTAFRRAFGSPLGSLRRGIRARKN